MNLIKYNSKGLENFIDNFFNRNIGDFLGSDFAISHPSVNVVETEDNFRLELAAPGLEKEDFRVNIEKDYLKVSVEKKQESEVKEDKYTRREFNYTTFKRSFQLPDTVDTSEIGANYENGVLKITLPKKEEAKAPAARVIEIQ